MLKNYTLVALLCFTCTWAMCNTDQIRNQYIEFYKDLAINESHRSNIPVSIILAQGILESQAGKSNLAMNSRNHFGIKCKSTWTGQKYYHEDDDYDANGNLTKSCFRVYESVEDSYRDHSNFLIHRERYSSLFELKQDDYVGWAIGLQKCGYATNQSYALLLIDLIEKYGLNEYDIKAIPPIVMQENTLAIVEENNIEYDVFDSNIKTEDIIIPPAVEIPANYRPGNNMNTEKAVPSYSLGNHFQQDTDKHTVQDDEVNFSNRVHTDSALRESSNIMRTLNNTHLKSLTNAPKANSVRRR